MPWKHTLRTATAESLQSVLPYTAYELDTAEYLGTYDGDARETAQRLRDRGYHYQLFAATKQHPSRDQRDQGSFARIPDAHPPEAAETGLAPLDARECQYHVQLFERDRDGADSPQTELYGHYEVHPYPHAPTWDITRPYPRHYYPTWDHADHGSANPYSLSESTDHADHGSANPYSLSESTDHADHGSANPYSLEMSVDNADDPRDEWTYLRGVTDDRLNELF